MSTLFLAALSPILLAAAQPSAAPTVGKAPVSARDPQSIVRALQGGGYKAVLSKTDGDDPMIRSASSGTNFTIFFMGCTRGEECATIQFYTGYDMKKPPKLEKLNDWNRDFRFGRAYLDKVQDPVIEMDLDLDKGGISEELFVENLTTWTNVLASFEKHIGW